MSDDIVRVRTKGRELTGWTSVQITAGITMAARSFTVGITFAWPQVKDVISGIQPDDPVEVWIGTDPVLTGFVFATPLSYGPDSLQVSITGRSRTADIVDCSPAAWLPGDLPQADSTAWASVRAVSPSGRVVSAASPKATQWKAQKVEQIAADLCGPYGIEVVAEVETGDPITLHAIDPGETVFDSINRLLTSAQLFATDDEAGRLVLTKPGASGNASGGLETGVNILTGSRQRDATEVFSDYVVTGQRSGSDEAFGAATLQVMASQKDEASTRFRLLELAPSGEMTLDLCQQIGAFESRRRRALLQSVSYTVVGWRDAQGKLWRPNTMVHVKDSFFGLDADLLIAEVQYSLSEQGSITTLNLAPVEAFESEPTAAEKAGDENSSASWLDEVKTPGA